MWAGVGIPVFTSSEIFFVESLIRHEINLKHQILQVSKETIPFDISAENGSEFTCDLFIVVVGHIEITFKWVDGCRR